MTQLAEKQCVPCRGGIPPLTAEEISPLLEQISNWEVIEAHHIQKTFTSENFKSALDFVNRVGGDCRRTGTSPRPLSGLGQGRGQDLDPQNQRPQ